MSVEAPEARGRRLFQLDSPRLSRAISVLISGAIRCYTSVINERCEGEAAMDSWIGVGLVILFVIFQIIRAAFRGAKTASGGMARLNAAAERILKERSTPASSPMPR